VTGAAAILALLLSIALLCTQRIDAATRLCALQAVFAAAASGEATLAVAVILLNAIALPLAMTRLDAVPEMIVRGHWLVSCGVTLAVLLVAITTFTKLGSGQREAIGASVMLLGLLLIALRSHPLVPTLGLLAAQNGLVLAAGANPDLPPQAAAAVAIPLIPTLVLADRWMHR
jgi:hypothetical protein